MKKPNLALRLMASAISAKRKSLSAKSDRAANAYAREAQRYLRAAALASDAGNAVRIISASNKKAAVTASKMRADFDDVGYQEDDIIVNDLDDIDSVFSEDEFYGDDSVFASENDEDDDEDDEDDKDDDKDEDKEVDSAMLRVLSRNRRVGVRADRRSSLRAARVRRSLR